MRYLLIVTLFLSSGAFAFVPGTSWQIQFNGMLDTTKNVQVYDIDLFDTKQTDINALKARGVKVICYISAGTWENWRPDASKFPAYVKGRSVSGWAGERWLDVRQISAIMPIMEARMDLAVQKGCDAIDPDNQDGYTHRTGFKLTYYQQIAYNKAIMAAARSRGMLVGLKNNIEQIADLLPYFDFAINEECYAWKECEALLPIINSGKAVFNIEYDYSTSQFCPQANSLNLDAIKKNLSLDVYMVACR